MKFLKTMDRAYRPLHDVSGNGGGCCKTDLSPLCFLTYYSHTKKGGDSKESPPFLLPIFWDFLGGATLEAWAFDLCSHWDRPAPAGYIQAVKSMKNFSFLPSSA